MALVAQALTYRPFTTEDLFQSHTNTRVVMVHNIAMGQDSSIVLLQYSMLFHVSRVIDAM
jgi:hypothetical protein